MTTKCTRCGRVHPPAMRGSCPRRVKALIRNEAPTVDNRPATRGGRATPLAKGTTWIDYRIEELIDAGGWGAVYRATHRVSQQTVALKVVLPHLAGDERVAARFDREARAMADLAHPNIVRLAAHGRDLLDGRLHSWIAMEYVDGVPLALLLRTRGRFAPDEACGVVTQVCDALAYAHGRGLIHRDLTPMNILIAKDGRVKLVDFGLVKSEEADPPRAKSDAAPGDLTQDDDFVGTRKYASPEQRASAADVDARTDLYSLGVIFYRMLTGRFPTMPWVPASEDVLLDGVVLTALMHNRNARYRDARHMKESVEALTADLIDMKHAMRILRVDEAGVASLVSQGELRCGWEQGRMRFHRREVERVSSRIDQRRIDLHPPRPSTYAMAGWVTISASIALGVLQHYLRARGDLLPANLAFVGWMVGSVMALVLIGVAVCELHRARGAVKGWRIALWCLVPVMASLGVLGVMLWRL